MEKERFQIAAPHFLGALCLLAPYLGLLAAIFYWLAKKYERAEFDREGRNAINFQAIYFLAREIAALSLLIPSIAIEHQASLVGMAFDVKVIHCLSFVIGILTVTGFGFSLLAGYKTYNGLDYRYPISFDVIGLVTRRK